LLKLLYKAPFLNDFILNEKDYSSFPKDQILKQSDIMIYLTDKLYFTALEKEEIKW
jgi:hypothetical protein